MLLTDYGLANETVQASNVRYALEVQMYGEVLYLKFFSVFSEQFINDEILVCKCL